MMETFAEALSLLSGGINDKYRKPGGMRFRTYTSEQSGCQGSIGPMSSCTQPVLMTGLIFRMPGKNENSSISTRSVHENNGYVAVNIQEQKLVQ